MVLCRTKADLMSGFVRGGDTLKVSIETFLTILYGHVVLCRTKADSMSGFVRGGDTLKVSIETFLTILYGHVVEW